jgi:hypothetical protein
MRIAVRLMVFMFMLNLGAGIFNYMGQEAGWNQPVAYSASNTELNALQGQVSGPPVESETNFGEKILDLLSLGMYSLLRDFLKGTIFGFTTLLFNVGIITDAYIIYILNTGLTFVYVMGMLRLFSRTDIEA